jgi:hypothetical protein
LIRRPQAIDERTGRRGGRGEPVARHAEAAIMADRNRQGELSGGKRPDDLRRTVFFDPEIGCRQAGDGLAPGVGHRNVNLDGAHAGSELGRPRGRRVAQGQSSQQDAWYNRGTRRNTNGPHWTA